MQAEEIKPEEKWQLVIEEVQRRTRHYADDHASAQDLEGHILEHLVKVSTRAPRLNILDNEHYRVRTETNATKDWLSKQKVYRARFQHLYMVNVESGDEYETDVGSALDTCCDDEQFAAFERSDLADVANAEIRKTIGKRGAQLLDAVKALDTLEPAKLAEALETRPETINSQFYSIRQKGKLLEI